MASSLVNSCASLVSVAQAETGSRAAKSHASGLKAPVSIERSAPASRAIFRKNVQSHSITASRQHSVRCQAVETVSVATADTSGDEEAKPKTKKVIKRKARVNLEDIEVGQKFTAKVKSVQSYGAFVSFGAANDGLVHISELTDRFVEDVNDVVKVGDEVEVRVLSVDVGAGRVGMSMKSESEAREPRVDTSDGTFDRNARGKVATMPKGQRRQGGGGQQRRERKSKAGLGLKEGQEMQGTVRSIAAFGAFVEVMEGVDGLLHISDMGGEFVNSPEDVVSEGQSLTVYIKSINGEKLGLTLTKPVAASEMEGKLDGLMNDNVDVSELPNPLAAAFASLNVHADMYPQGTDSAKAAADKLAEAAANKEDVLEEEEKPMLPDMPEGWLPAAEREKAAAAEAPAAEEAAPEPVAEAPPADAPAKISAKDVKVLRDQSGAGMMDCKKALVECGGDMQAASEWLRKKGIKGAEKKQSRIATEGNIVSYIHTGARTGVLVEVNCETDFVGKSDKFKDLCNTIAMQIAANPDVAYVNTTDVDPEFLAQEKALEMQKEDLQSKPENIREKIVEGRLAKLVGEKALMEQPFIMDTTKTVDLMLKEKTAEIGEKLSIRRFSRFNLGEGMEKKVEDFAGEVEAQMQKKEEEPKAEAPAPAPVEEVKEDQPAVKVSAKDVKVLREQSGAGMMDCKKALVECNNDMQAASEWLRKKGIKGAEKKQSRIATEGAIVSYIHTGARTGVLVEVNCETDFVGKSDKFKELCNTISMQIAANPDVDYVSTTDVDPEFLAQEKALEMQKEDLQSKPENIREKIVEGRLAKLVGEKALMEQPFIMDTTKTVGDMLVEKTAEIGEKLSIRRFSRFNLGEGMEKKEEDFAAEVAAQMGQ